MISTVSKLAHDRVVILSLSSSMPLLASSFSRSIFSPAVSSLRLELKGHMLGHGILEMLASLWIVNTREGELRRRRSRRSEVVPCGLWLLARGVDEQLATTIGRTIGRNSGSRYLESADHSLKSFIQPALSLLYNFAALSCRPSRQAATILRANTEQTSL